MPTSTVIRPPQTAAPTAPCACRSLTRHHFGVCAKLTSSMSLRGVGGCDFEGRRQASARRIHALMPTSTAGDRRCVRYLRDRLLSSVLNHTPGPLLSATERRPMTLNCRPPGREKRALDDDGVCPACLLTVIHTPPNPYTLDGWLPMRPGWWGMRDGATLPTCPNCDEPALLLNLLREAKQKGPTT